MALVDLLSRFLGRGQPPISLDAPPASGAAREATVPLIRRLREQLPLELRSETTTDYLEGVLPAAALESSRAILEEVLGPPAKPFGARPRFEAALEKLVDSRGGIEKGQCLFLRRFADGRVAFAALWPWSGGERVTLKVGVYDQLFDPG
jgi:hypothetical protein